MPTKRKNAPISNITSSRRMYGKELACFRFRRGGAGVNVEASSIINQPLHTAEEQMFLKRPFIAKVLHLGWSRRAAPCRPGNPSRDERSRWKDCHSEKAGAAGPGRGYLRD